MTAEATRPGAWSRRLSLRQRLLLAPLAAILLLAALLAGMIVQAGHHDARLAQANARHLGTIDRYADALLALTERHLALDNLLSSVAQLDPEVARLRTQASLGAIDEALSKINTLLDGDNSGKVPGLAAQLSYLRQSAQAYRQTIALAATTASARPNLATAQIAPANERFAAMSASFSQVLELRRQALESELGAEASRQQGLTLAYVLSALAGAGLLLLLSDRYARRLSAALQRQVDALKQDSQGPAQDQADGDVIGRIGEAVAGVMARLTRLGESELRFRRFFEHHHAVMLQIDPRRGAILAANQAAAEFYGYSREQLCSLRLDDIAVATTGKSAAERQAPQQDSRHLCATHRLADGGERLVEVHAAPVETIGETVLFLIIHDVTQRQQVEAALRASQAALNDAQAVAKVGSWTLDLRSDALSWSQETYRIFGVPCGTPQTLESFVSHVHPLDRDFVLTSWKAALLGQPYDIEHRIEVAGEIRWVRECAHIRRDSDGVTILGIGTVQDITELRQAQQALRELNHDLEQRVAERTAQLEAASQAKSDFLSRMSHEIRTPMNSVLGMAHLALRTRLTPKQRDYVEKIHGSGQHLLGLIDSILDLSKIEAGKFELDAVDFTFAKMMEDLRHLCAPQATAKGLRLAFDFGPDIPARMHGDPLRLSQVLINFTTNAIKFTERGEIRVSARILEPRPDACCLLRFEIEDSGVGISKADQDRLFQVFQQGASGGKRRQRGSGLGLAISKQLVNMMGGEVGMVSAPGQGSTFWFTVKLSKASAAVHSSSCDSPCCGSLPSGSQALNMIKGARLLVADDHPLNQQVARELLEAAGATVCVANDGREAVALLRQQSFDCLLLDVHMPELDGYATTRCIRADPALADLPVIALTASAWNQDRDGCLAAGMNDFVSKPIRPERLYACVAKWLATLPPQRRQDPAPSGNAPGGTCDDPRIIDLAVPARALQSDPEKVGRIARKFVEATWIDLARMEAALERGDLATLGDLGHRIKSPAQALGAMGLVDLCQGLEALRRGGSTEQAGITVRRMRALLEQISQRVHSSVGSANAI